MFYSSRYHPSQFIVAAILSLASVVNAQSNAPTKSVRPAPSTFANLRASAQEALSQYPEVDPVVIGPNGTPFVLKGRFDRLAASGKSSSVADISRILPNLAKFVDLTPANLDVVSDQVDQIGHRHVAYSVKLNDRLVVGARLLIHINAEGYIYMINGTVPDETKTIPVYANVDIEAAKAKVREAHKTKSPSTKNERLIYFLPGEGRPLSLAWEIPLSLDEDRGQFLHKSYVDAVSGELLLTAHLVSFAKHRSVRDLNGALGYDFDTGLAYRPSTVSRDETGLAVTASAVNSNWTAVGKAHDYFYALPGQYYDGPNGSGNLTETTVVNSKFNSGGNPGTDFGNNAVYIQLNFGSGNEGHLYFGTGANLSPNQASNYGATLDVTAHEFTHWISDIRSIGPLNNHTNNEAGAIDEGISDIFGAMVERYNKGYTDSDVWLFGETTGTTIRSLASPATIGATLDYYPNFTSSTEVHDGAGIIDLAFKLLATGGPHPFPSGKPNLVVPGIGEAAAEQALFFALRYYIPTNPSFQSMKYYTATAAEALGTQSAGIATFLAWDAVGVPYNTGNLRAVNISTRAYVGTGNDVLVAGFVMSGGSGSKSMLVRGVGPALTSMGVTGALSDPYLDMGSVGSNNDWGANSNWATIQSTASAVGAFPLASGSADAALLPSLSAGVYTAVVSGVSSGTGTGMIEVYDTNTSTSLRLVNISSRAKVTTSDPLIAGFVVTGNTGKKLLIRAIGPSVGVSGALSDPKLTITNNGTAIYTNDNWSSNWNASSIVSVSSTIGAFALSSGTADSVLLIDLPPGAYSAIVEGVSGAQGIALVEVYEAY